jgi:hypothetical protein
MKKEYNKIMLSLPLLGPLYIQPLPWPQTERTVADKEKAIDAAAGKFYKACLDRSLPLPTLNSYINFFSYQKLSYVCWQYLPADYAFYTGKDYYYDINMNPVTRAVIKTMVGVVMNIMKHMAPGNIPWPGARKEEKK